MDNLRAVMIAEGAEESTEEEFFSAWQHLIDTGVVWQLQGFFGRQAADMIAGGHCYDTYNVLGCNPHA